MKKVLFFLLSVTLMGCTQYGEIVNNTLLLDFPIIVPINNLDNKWEIDTTYGKFPDPFKLRVNVNRIKGSGLLLENNFQLEFTFDGTQKINESGDILFDRLLVKFPSNVKDSIMYKIRTTGSINYVNYCEENWLIVDMEYFIVYDFLGSDWIYIKNIKSLYKNRLY